MKYKSLLLIIVFAAAFFIRFYNYEKRVTFGPEQAISLITSGRMVTEKFSLLGNQNLQRATSTGHSLFAGALFSYSLIPLQLIFNYHAFPITIYFTLLNLFTGLMLFILVRRMYGQITAVYSSILFLFSSIAIYHSLFIWNQNYIFLISIFSFYILFKLTKNKISDVQLLILGFLTGAAISIQDLYVLTALLILATCLYYSKNKVKVVVLLGFGIAAANLPAIIFDLRHNFYHLKTAWTYATESLSGSNSPSLAYYHFLQFVPPVFIVAGILLKKLHKRNLYISLLIITIFVYINVTSSWVDFFGPTGMPDEVTIDRIYEATKAISKDQSGDFNVSSVIDFDKRAHVLRYPLEFTYKTKPMDEISYDQSKDLYVLAEKTYNFEESTIWELSSFPKKEVKTIYEFGKNYSIFKLSK
jgi:hypothetical protein